jgi:hypothetical protein
MRNKKKLTTKTSKHTTCAGISIDKKKWRGLFIINTGPVSFRMKRIYLGEGPNNVHFDEILQ